MDNGGYAIWLSSKDPDCGGPGREAAQSYRPGAGRGRAGQSRARTGHGLWRGTLIQYGSYRALGLELSDVHLDQQQHHTPPAQPPATDS